jgi:hypothetical protein
MAENNFLFLIQQKKQFLKSDFFYRLVILDSKRKFSDHVESISSPFVVVIFYD